MCNPLKQVNFREQGVCEKLVYVADNEKELCDTGPKEVWHNKSYSLPHGGLRGLINEVKSRLKSLTLQS